MPIITVKDVMGALSVSERTAKRIRQQMRQRGILQPVNQRKVAGRIEQVRRAHERPRR